MRHPFELQLSELETINFAIEEISDENSEQVAGGRMPTPSIEALGEEGGDKPTTYATGLNDSY